MIELGIVILAIIGVMLIGSVFQATYFRSKKKRIKPYGQLINVFDGQLHIFKMGKGKEKIILLSGIGIGLPSADFGPLMRKLSEKHTVVSIEYFGVGFSSQTNRARTSENYIEEIREALNKAGIETPYVLMAHSISSVYSEYYASKYPKEIKAIISLDGTSTSYIGPEMPGFVKSLLNIAKFQQAIGFISVMASLVTNKKKLLSLGYTKKEISDILSFAGFSMNRHILDQIAGMASYVKDANACIYPKDVPYFKIIAKKTYETKNKQIKITPQRYQEEHLARIGEQTKYEILDGNHFIYLHQVERIAEITSTFLMDINTTT
jgi:pimeloyl-ACP methyl ester carboxylesterase